MRASNMPEFIKGSLQKLVDYFQDIQTEADPKQFMTATQRSLDDRIKILNNLQEEEADIERRIQLLSAETNSTKRQVAEDSLANAYGLKPAALVRFLW